MATEAPRSAEYVRWEVRRQQVQPGVKRDKEDLIAILAEGWEPFAVTWDGSSWDYHFRRQIDGGVAQ